jgi:HD-GYP domain-containing protein (c-di-GMP phosphodiesterase class II)
MEQRRLGMSDITMGEPLPWDVYDDNNRLLLAKGSVVHRESQVNMLVERGLFVVLGEKRRTQTVSVKEVPSALRIIRDANVELSRVLLSLTTAPDAQKRLRSITQMLGFAIDVNRDVALATILHNKEGSYAVRHCIDAAIVALLVARSLNKSPAEIQALTAAALTMNVSMLAVQENLQNKREGLNEKEMEMVRRHPHDSAALLKIAGIDDEKWLNCVLDHHENEDGSGYPNGKRGDEIDANAKILAVADRYCASISSRSYRKSLLPNAAMHDVLLAHRTEIDPSLIACFVREFGTYPTGTFVRLENGEIGLVTGKGASTTTPIVHSLVGPRGAPLSYAIRRDTSTPLNAVREVLDEERAAIRFQLHQIWGDDARE